MQRNWTTAGDGLMTRSDAAVCIAELDWQPTSTELPACQGLAIQAAIADFRLPKVSAVAWNVVVENRYSLLGIEANYTNGRCRLYLLDRGSVITPICSDFWPKEEAA